MIILAASAALLSAVQVTSEPCPSREASWVEPDAPPAERFGAGLWIGGQPFTADDFISAEVITDTLLDALVIDIRLSPQGVARFQAVQRCRVGLQIEISFDGRVISRPVLNEPILGNGLQLSGGFDHASAKELAAKIKP
ncbi:SecDF P1 head subdomain-containing protein [Sphingomonas sp.]|jgi:preprotein translocase subunit SecD|uniref:SecDF P1 head subdomain-containing protein n=1 Tax=Sphingomonas sp. TaxID=28214 RepID=UPI003F7015DF